jgi:hypothetical protein
MTGLSHAKPSSALGLFVRSMWLGDPLVRLAVVVLRSSEAYLKAKSVGCHCYAPDFTRSQKQVTQVTDGRHAFSKTSDSSD